MSNSLKDFITASKTPLEVRDDLKELFPPFAGLGDDILDRYIDISYCNIPGGFVNCGFDCAYQGFLFGVAHNLAYYDVLGTGTGIASLKKNVSSKSAGALSIAYQNETSTGTPSNIFNYFGTTAYGQTMLSMLDTCGLTMSPGGFVV